MDVKWAENIIGSALGRYDFENVCSSRFLWLIPPYWNIITNSSNLRIMFGHLRYLPPPGTMILRRGLLQVSFGVQMAISRILTLRRFYLMLLRPLLGCSVPRALLKVSLGIPPFYIINWHYNLVMGFIDVRGIKRAREMKCVLPFHGCCSSCISDPSCP